MSDENVLCWAQCIRADGLRRIVETVAVRLRKCEIQEWEIEVAGSERAYDEDGTIHAPCHSIVEMQYASTGVLALRYREVCQRLLDRGMHLKHELPECLTWNEVWWDVSEEEEW